MLKNYVFGLCKKILHHFFFMIVVCRQSGMKASLTKVKLSNERHETQLFMLRLTAPLRCQNHC